MMRAHKKGKALRGCKTPAKHATVAVHTRTGRRIRVAKFERGWLVADDGRRYKPRVMRVEA